MTMETVLSGASVAEAALGSSSSMDSFTMYTEATMKMIRSTSITSTSGVTLSSWLPSWSWILEAPAMTVRVRGCHLRRAPGGEPDYVGALQLAHHEPQQEVGVVQAALEQRLEVVERD